MLLLKRGEKPGNDIYKHSETVDYRDRNSNVLWLTEEEYNSEVLRISQMKDERFRELINDRIGVWREYAILKSKKIGFGWFEKYASVFFWTGEGKFIIYPEDLGEDIDDYMFALVERAIQSELKEFGALLTRYNGMLD